MFVSSFVHSFGSVYQALYAKHPAESLDKTVNRTKSFAFLELTSAKKADRKLVRDLTVLYHKQVLEGNKCHGERKKCRVKYEVLMRFSINSAVKMSLTEKVIFEQR